MTFFADENFPRPAVRVLRDHGFDVIWAAETSPGASDEDLLARCAEHRFILLTLDKDFGELLFRKGLPADCGVNCGVILFRVDRESPEQFAKLVLTAL